MRISPGRSVLLLTPDNPYLHEQRGVVRFLTDYGAIVVTAVGSGEFRALTSEMVPIEETNGYAKAQGEIETVVDNPPVAPERKKKDKPTTRSSQVRESGFTGDICSNCQGSKMRRTGTCVTCQDCGNNEGCG